MNPAKRLGTLYFVIAGLLDAPNTATAFQLHPRPRGANQKSLNVAASPVDASNSVGATPSRRKTTIPRTVSVVRSTSSTAPSSRKQKSNKNTYKMKSQKAKSKYLEAIFRNSDGTSGSYGEEEELDSKKKRRSGQLTFEDECYLAAKMKEMNVMVEIREKLKARLNREPHEYEWALEVYGADVVNMGTSEVQRRLLMVEDLRRTVEDGQEARSKLVGSHIGLVIHIAKKYQGRGLQLADLVQEGNMGLIEAAKRFDPKKGFRFMTYARWWIRQRISKSIADYSRVIRLPVHVHTMLRNMERTKKEMLKVNGREPTVPELAHEMQVPVEKIQLYTSSSAQVLSLECPLNAKSDGSDNRVLMDTIQSDSPTPEEHIEYASLRKDIFSVIDELNEREREVVVLRFGLNDELPKNIDEIASILKISRERVRTIESKALNKLRHPLRNYKLKEYVGCANQPQSQEHEFDNDYYRAYSAYMSKGSRRW
mmetsp:Transcript_2114/g.3350  ORF Transcript_2114/g.3350 Transcript_2114/m.3350 type:complete len:482 (-) Transcript_2114:3107-4552(-)